MVSVWFYAANLIGYFRIITGIVGFYFYKSNPLYALFLSCFPLEPSLQPLHLLLLPQLHRRCLGWLCCSFSQPMYFLLLCISAVNRFQVRCLPRYDHRQVFHSSDSWISLSSRRFCSSGLLIVLAYYYPDETYYYILLMTLDIVSHWTQMYAYGSLLFS